MESIKTFRGKKGMTQKTLAEHLNVDRSTIAKWETGHAQPRIEKLPQIANLLDCTIGELMCIKGE